MKKIIALIFVILLVGCVEVQEQEHTYTLLIHKQSILTKTENTHTFIEYYSEKEIIIINNEEYNGEFYLWIDESTLVNLEQRSD